MDWLNSTNKCSIKLDVTTGQGLVKATDAIAWGSAKFGSPYSINSKWNIDAENGKFIITFKNFEDYTLFVLTCT